MANNHPKVSRSGYILLPFLAIIAGTIAAYGAIAFRFVLTGIQSLFYGFSHDNVYSAASALTWYHLLLVPTLGGLLIGLLAYRFSSGRRPYGPADAMQAVKAHDGKIPVRDWIFGAFLSASSLGVGASTGLYGPIVHMGAGLGSWMAQTLRLNRNQTITLLGCGVSSAIAATFNAPMGGVIFAHEVILGHYAPSAFAPITIAAVVGAAIVQYHLGDAFVFLIPEAAIRNIYEYPLFALVGLLSAILAMVFMRCMLGAEDLVKRTTIPRWASPMVGGFLLGCGTLVFPQIIGLGNESINAAINNLFPLWLLLALIPAKILATSVSVSFGFGGGVFGPSLFLGAMLGGVAGNLFNEIFMAIGLGMELTPTIYIVVGMGALISCVIGAPIATILIIFEMTNSFTLATAVMLGVVVGNIVINRIFDRSYFIHQLRLRGVDPDEGREIMILKSRKVQDVMHDRFHTVAESTKLADVEEILFSTQSRRKPDGTGSIPPAKNSAGEGDVRSSGEERRQRPGHYHDREFKYQDLSVVGKDGKFLGHITMFDLTMAQRSSNSRELNAGSIAKKPDLILECKVTINEAMGLLARFVGISIPVVDTYENGRLVGILYESSVIDAYNQAVEKARAEERGLD